MTHLVSIDTSVLVEYIDESGVLHSQAKIVIDNVGLGKLRGLIAHPVFAELYYISYKLYEKFPTEEEPNNQSLAQSKAESLIDWLFRSPNILMPENSIKLAIEAGRIKSKYSLALPDCYVIASAKINQCDAIFKSPEEEMIRGTKLVDLKREEKVNLIFLKDYA